MKSYQIIYVVVAIACSGCFSKEQAESSGAASSPVVEAKKVEEQTGLPEEARNLRFSVIQHTGGVTDWRITMQEFATGFRKWANPEAKIVWERDGQDKWIVRLTRYDKVTQTEGRMIMAFKKEGNKAVLYRYVLDDKEYFQQYISTLVNDVVYQVLVQLGKVDESKRLPASE